MFSGAAIAAPCPAPQTLSPLFKVDRVIDGDTVKLENGSRVRLTGFNTFELKDSGRKRDYALKAKRRAIEVLPEAIQVAPWPHATAGARKEGMFVEQCPKCGFGVLGARSRALQRNQGPRKDAEGEVWRAKGGDDELCV